MIVPDLNLILYAHFEGFEEHAVARAWWEATLAGDETVGLTAPVIFGFLRLSTNPRIFEPPMPVEQALEAVHAWLAQPPVHFLGPGPRHLELCFELLRALGCAANLTTDAQIAAHAIEQQATLCSNDSDFGRFSGLRVVNPLLD